ncbi:MAG TPA: DUF92 domain-containing protein [Thermoplasmata archaeon]|nr:DUF92 domain-containing protein [Thermoplasmata archaeon]
MLGFPLALVGVAVTAALAAAAVYAGALTSWAGLVAAAFGSVIVDLVGFAYLALLVLFVVASVLATRYALEEKQRRNVQEGTKGERGVSNVLAHIVVPTALVGSTLLPGLAPPTSALTALYASALAFGAADTFASEFGVLQGRALSILTLRPVAPGTNGGISAVGTVWAAVGALTTGVVGYGLFRIFHVAVGPPAGWIALVALAGFAACQIDSVLGETLENRGLLTKGGTNFLAMLSAVALAAVVLGANGSL